MSEFTFDEYKSLLQKAKQHFQFLSYSDYKDDLPGVYWRHDLDLSVHAALKMAEIEADLDLQATYFIYPHCRFYNFYEKGIAGKIKRILSLGHHLGLHFDTQYYDNLDLENDLAKETRVLETVFDRPVEVFSFHDPSTEIISSAKDELGMVNTYNEYFRQKVVYVSDSNGRWRYKSLSQVLDEAPERLQVLTHPGWWTKDLVPTQKEKLHHIIEGRADSVKEMVSQIEDYL